MQLVITLTIIGFFNTQANQVPTIFIDQIKSSKDIVKIFPANIIELDLIKDQAIAWINRVDEIVNLPLDQQNFNNTFELLDQITYEWSNRGRLLQLITNAYPDENMRDKAQQHCQLLTDLSNQKLTFNKQLYTVLKNYADQVDNHKNLKAEQKYFITSTMQDFIRSGLQLKDQEFAQVQALRKELGKLNDDFRKNIRIDQQILIFSLEELVGTPKNTLDSLEKTTDNRLIVKSHEVVLSAILDYCQNQEVRKKIYDLSVNIGYPKNQLVLTNMINKRDELAKLLGFESYATLELDSQMAKKITTVEKLLRQLATKAKIKASQECQLFLDAYPNKAELTNDQNQIFAWNLGYLKNYYLQHNFNLNLQEVAEYFPVDHTVDMLLQIYEQFMDLRFKRQKINLWVQNLELLEVYSNANFIGYIVLDLYPRKNKFRTAASIAIANSIKSGGDFKPGLNVILASFPIATENSSALLQLANVKTFFHEFGHALHALLGATQIASISGLNVQTDFLEMPSKMLENWLQDPVILKKISCHYKTKQTIPDVLIEKLVTLEKFGAGNYLTFQLVAAQLSLDLFKAGTKKNIQQILFDTESANRPHIANYGNNHMCAKFSHLTSYGAKYYGYIWANILARDLFEKIKTNGLLNPKVGLEYIEKVLSRGGAQDPNELIENFLGRKPNQIAFLTAMGLN